MNFPTINNNMKSSSKQPKSTQNINATGSFDGFGLGIQVFKIESSKDVDLKSKNRNNFKNIQNPKQAQTVKSIKTPMIPKPKRLPSIEKPSTHNLTTKQTSSGFINSKVSSQICSGKSDKILQRKGVNLNIQPSKTSQTPSSFSMSKKINVITEKKTPFQKASYFATSADSKQKVTHQQSAQYPIKKSKQTPIISDNQNKQDQIEYKHYNTQHNRLNRFYKDMIAMQRQNSKQARNLKRLKQNQQSEQVRQKIQNLESIQGSINSILQNYEKCEFDQKMKEIVQEHKVAKRNPNKINTVVPVTGFSHFTQFQIYDINSYQNLNTDYRGGFKVQDYENVDLMPMEQSQC